LNGNEGLFWAALVLLARELVGFVIGFRNKQGIKQAVETGMNQVKAHVDVVAAKPSPPTPESVETNVIVKQMLASYESSSEGWKLALQMATKRLDALVERMSDVESQNTIYKDKIETYKGELNKLLEEQNIRAEASRLNQEQIGALTEKMTGMEETQSRIAEELQKAQDALAETKRELVVTRESVQRLEAELQAERSEKARITSERDAALKKVSELEERVQELERQVYDLEAKLGITHPTPLLDPLAKSPLSLGHTPPLGTKSPFTTAVDDAGNIISSGTIPPVESVQ
jgi:uncharacterized phage infection (PIP) family protein YhgE